MPRRAVAKGLTHIFQGIEFLKEAFPHRAFTIDGRLVGDVGEIIASIEYDIVLDVTSRPIHDAKTSTGRDVQIKATFKDSLTFRQVPDLYLGIKLYQNGEFEEVYNGPGYVISERYSARKGFGTSLLSFPTSELKRLSSSIPSKDRVARRSPRQRLTRNPDS